MKIFLLLLTAVLTLSMSSLHSSKLINSISVVSFADSVENNSLSLKEVCANFNPKQLNLTNSIIENVELNKFLSNLDKNTITTNEDFDYFITMIILKQYQFQLTKFHQGYDLYSMRLGNAGFIVKSFVDLAKLPENIKGVQAEYILEYIASNEKLKNEPLIVEIVNSINALPK